MTTLQHIHFSGIVTMMSVYRAKSSLYEYLTAGLISGALYKVNIGLKGMVAGGIRLMAVQMERISRRSCCGSL
uniref:Uncharacterized protein n=1 Tax=Glossina palpalis gambiensis TaxID=67801 RepID=A0A1B0BP67_9MUSC